MRALLRHGAGVPPARAVAAAIVAPATATGIALALPHAGAATAESIYLLAVVLAAVAGGLWGGLAAAVLSFLGLNFFFFPPRHTLVVRGLEAVVALAVFLLVAVLVGGLLARALRDRARAEAREHQARTLNQISNLLASAGPLERTLEVVASRLVTLLELSSCRFSADERDVWIRTEPADPRGGGPVLSFELSAGARSYGRITVERAREAPAFGPGERSLLQAVAAQVGLVLEAEQLDASVRAVRLEAEASKLRAALFSSVTHDLRTPLASIKAGVTGLQNEEAVFAPEQRKELLEMVVEETDRLNRMVGNLLDLARFRSAALSPQKEPTDIDELIGSVVGRLTRTLAPFEVRVRIHEDLPPVAMDPLQIDQVLSNLLENAARFSPPGTDITISARPSHSFLQVTVADRGPGIPPEEREKVFEEFYRQDRGSGRGGTGLGLAIARAVIAAHGGSIRVEGVAGGGTAVVFELPMSAEPTADRVAGNGERGAEPNGDGDRDGDGGAP